MRNLLIRQSHERCVILNSNSKSLIDKDRVKSDFDIQLSNITWNCIKNIRSSFFTLYNTFFTLSNIDLLVINHFINKNSNADMNKYIPPVGTSLKEEDYGTSATSIAKLKGDVAYVIKNEHFQKRSKDLTCVAAPIRLSNEIIGYLSLSSLDIKQVNALRVFMESLSINIEHEINRKNLKNILTKNLNTNENVILNKNVLNFLSDNEKVILEYIFKNYTNEMMAENMFISETAVRRYIHSIYKKTGTKNKIDMLVNLIYKDIFSLI